MLETENRPQYLVLMLQKEVAERLSAKPGNSERGILTVMIELFGTSEIIDIVKKENFYPIPDVDSAIIKIILKNSAEIQNMEKINIDVLMRLVKIGFSQKRRQIHHPLMAGLKLSKDEILDILKIAKINPKLRAEDLEIGDWVKLEKEIKI
jgi:16S rRNA (adenine1518-N6/adenine1519-N6)-dimethyltransferase